MNSMRLTERQVRALWTSIHNAAGWKAVSVDDLTINEMTDLRARLYVASHPETVAHIVGMEVE